MKIRKFLCLAAPALILTTPVNPAFSAGSKSAVAAQGGQVALAIGSEIVTPIVAEQIMQVFGISSGSKGIDYDRIGEIVRDVVRDENKKQTMGRLLGQIGGVNKSVETILTLAGTDTPEAGIESLNDTNIREKINALSLPLDQILAEFEGKYTGEAHGIIEAYLRASHLKLSLALLQERRALADKVFFLDEIKKKGKKSSPPMMAKKGVSKKDTAVGPQTYEQLIASRENEAKAQSIIYANQAIAAFRFVHMLAYNDRQALEKAYKKNVSPCIPMGNGYFDKNSYDPWGAAGGDAHRLGGARLYLRNLPYKKSFPTVEELNNHPARRALGGSVSSMKKALIKNEQSYDFKKASDCKAKQKAHLAAVPTAVFYQTELRYGVRDVYALLGKQRVAAGKLAKKLEFKIGTVSGSKYRINKRFAKAFKE